MEWIKIKTGKKEIRRIKQFLKKKGTKKRGKKKKRKENKKEKKEIDTVITHYWIFVADRKHLFINTVVLC